MTIRILKLALGAPLILAAALVAGPSRVSFAQGDADLEAPGLESFAAPVGGGTTLFQNVRIFDGRSSALSAPSNVLVKGGIIERISASPIAVDANANVRTIAAGGRVLMPGLIDAHWHAFMAATPQMVLMTADPNYLLLLAARQAEATLMRGFTTVRDLGGPVFGLKRAIDEGVTIGPRIYPSGAFISQTSGHGDFRFSFELPRLPGGPLSHSEVEGIAAIADSPDEVRLRTREQLRQGASQIKLMAGGGVASPYNPIESTQYTEPEIRAAVEAADNWGTYVTVHAYTPRAIRQALAAGVKCIEHGQLIDEPTAKLLADNGIWWSLQPLLDDEDAPPLVNPVSQKKALEVFAGTDNAYKLAKKYNVKTAFGTDILFDARLTTPAGGDIGQDDTLVYARRNAQNGHRRQRRVDGAFRIYQSLSRQTWCGRRGRHRRFAAGRRQPAGKYQACRRSGQELSRHHEGGHDLQRHRDEVGEARSGEEAFTPPRLF